MNIVSKTPMSSVTLPAQDDPYAEVAMEGGGQFGKILKYVKGQWWHDETEVSLGTEFVALMHEAMRGDVRFQNGKPVEQRIGYIRDRARFARREDLGFTDQTVWEMDKKGNPTDPWSRQTYLPLIHVESGELYCFIFRSAGATQAFRDLCQAYSPRRKTSALPIVSLQTDRYKHADYGLIDVPVLKIEHWDDTGLAPAPEPDGKIGNNGGINTAGESKPSASSEMNDEIQF